ncbi:hypothetical protein [Nonomuraea pusilla]|nr:hypothetical protein [Nonomuraea pusilla]
MAEGRPARPGSSGLICRPLSTLSATIRAWRSALGDDVDRTTRAGSWAA